MINLLIWFAAFLCPNPSHTLDNHGNCTLMHGTILTTENETGGETGGLPRPPFPPPPPPPPTGN
ncbi:MAG: hypothetical protein NTW29_15560 [Bacteroidetes bacterium]|nr:hypothetical protein [Bacteroidota bacterium]